MASGLMEDLGRWPEVNPEDRRADRARSLHAVLQGELWSGNPDRVLVRRSIQLAADLFADEIHQTGEALAQGLREAGHEEQAELVLPRAGRGRGGGPGRW